MLFFLNITDVIILRISSIRDNTSLNLYWSTLGQNGKMSPLTRGDQQGWITLCLGSAFLKRGVSKTFSLLMTKSMFIVTRNHTRYKTKI